MEIRNAAGPGEHLLGVWQGGGKNALQEPSVNPNPKPWHPRPAFRQGVHTMLSEKYSSIGPPHVRQRDVGFLFLSAVSQSA